MSRFRLSSKEKMILQKLGEAFFPETELLPKFDAALIEDRLDRFFSRSESIQGIPAACRALLHVIDQGARLRYLRPMSSLAAGTRLDYLSRFWMNAPIPRRLSFKLFSYVLKGAYLDDQAIYQALGVAYRKPEVAPGSTPRWHSQIVHGKEIHQDKQIEAEVVVVGTGAGGATVAFELARRGNAVIMVEEGDYFNRTHFTGRPFEMQRLLYQRAGLHTTLGNVVIPVPLGRTVGGTTTINSGTCFRTPRRVLRHWRDNLGLTDYTPEAMEPYFRRVEKIFDVKPADMKVVGPNGKIIARGADNLGYRHGPLLRNAPDCEGEAVCCFGCPSGAKRSADVSFVPRALESHAQLVCRVRCEEIMIAGRRASGIRAQSLDTGKEVVIKAEAVVLAAGAFATPRLLMKQNLCNVSGQLGRNLSLHPCVGVLALMDEEVQPDKTIPQGYMVDEFEEEGILLEGAAFPLEALSLVLPYIGHKGQELIQNYRRLASFGVMVCDTSRGRVMPGVAGEPLAFYFLNKRDQTQLLRGIDILARIYLAAGALEVYANVHRWKPIRSLADLEHNMRLRGRAADMDIAAYHPLGTCHMGGSRSRAVCNPNGETYEISNLFIADGSLIPPSLGVNPQITIAAVAARVSDFVHDRLS